MVKFRTKRNSIENKFSISSLGIPHGIPFLFLLRPHFRGSPPYYFLFHFIDYTIFNSLNPSCKIFLLVPVMSEKRAIGIDVGVKNMVVTSEFFNLDKVIVFSFISTSLKNG